MLVHVGRRWRLLLLVLLSATVLPVTGWAQRIVQSQGVDPRVDYSVLTQLGPWDDRNYLLTRKDLALLAANEHELKDPIPVFYRVELRRTIPGLRRTGPAQYPRSALQVFFLKYGGYLVEGLLYEKATYKNGRFYVVQERGVTQEEFAERALSGDVRVTSPTGNAESAIKIHPTDVNRVIAGSNGPSSGQKMHYSTNGGSTWIAAAALPLGSTCCDPTVDWSSNGTKAYTATLSAGFPYNVWVYRSGDGGQTWNDLEAVTPGDPRREITNAGISDKEFLHVDKFATSPHRDNVYLTWHDNNVLQFSRSTDFAHTWSAPLTISSGAAEEGIGSDITTDRNGNIYYFWPAFNSQRILMRKSTNGGASFNTAVTVATTQDGYDFAIPAMETRRAFIYVAADTDLTSGPYSNSIYAAWTDTTAAEDTNNPANNHARIQVAYSRDGGNTWTVRTPHETANQNTVDRFHPWLAVGPDGRVYVLFYDTRRDPSRVAVDVFYSVSSNGGQTWSTPARLTSVISPQIDDPFEWGDYNGLDVIGSQFLGIFTDNRNESGGTTDSVDVYAAGLQIPQNQAPIASFTFSCSGLTCTFNASGSTDDNGIASYAWSFGDSGTGSGVTTSRTYGTTGFYTVTLTVTDTLGLQSTRSRKVSVTSEAPVAAEGFFTVSPCRAFDSRITGGILTSGVARTVQVTGTCSIPASAKAVSVNVTVVSPTGSGFLRFFPGNQSGGPFEHSTINFDPPTAPRSNNAILRLATNGAGTVLVHPTLGGSPGQTHLLLDVVGYFSEDLSPAPGAQGPYGFQTVSPCRIGDTRGSSAIPVNTSRNFTVQGICGVPLGAAAAALNPVVITPTAAGQATLDAAGPLASIPTIHFPAIDTLANGARTRLATTTPDVALHYSSPTAGSSTHALIDVYGYFKSDAPLKYRPITACRAVDTRQADQGGPALTPGARSFQIRGNCGVPASAKAVALNIVVVGQSGSGYLVVYPSGGSSSGSYLNFSLGQGTLGNGGILALSTQVNDLTVWTSTTTHLLIDVYGYFQ